MKKYLPILILSFLLFSINLYAIPSTDVQKEYYSDLDVHKIAIEKGLLPAKLTDEYMAELKAKNKTSLLWVMSERNLKIVFVDILKDLFKIENDAIIENPSAYYVVQINRVIYKAIRNNQYTRDTKGIIKYTLQTIAVMEGDYDIGKSKVETLKECLSEEGFKEYKETFPKKFQVLVNMDNK